MTGRSDQTGSLVGLTRDNDWQIGVRRTLPYPAATIWDVLVSDSGRERWLGPGAALPTEPRTAYRTSNRTTGEVRSYDPGRLIRLTWQPSDWDTASTLQIRLIAAPNGTTLSIHQERLDSAERRTAMRSHWSEVIDRLEAILTEEPEPV